MNHKSKQDILQWFPVVFLLAFICDFLWGSAFPSIKLGYAFFQIESSNTYTQILFAGMRFTIAGIMVILITCIRDRRLVYPKSSASLKRLATLSCFQTIIQYAFFYIGLAHTSGVKGSIIEASNVFICIFVTSIILRYEKLTSSKLIGSIIGFAGVVVINLQGLQLDLNIGDGFIFLSTFAYAMSSVLLKKYAKEDDTVMLSGYQFLVGGIVLMGLGFILGGRITHVIPEGIAMLCYLAFISAVAYTLWAILLAHNPVSRVAILGFLNPVCGVILSAFLLGEKQQAFGLRSIIALLFVCIGIFVVYRKKEDA